MTKIVSLFRPRLSTQTSDTEIFPDARALFERVIPNFSPDRARPLWERWARYEYQYGDLEAALKLEKRMAEVYTSGIITFSLSFSFIPTPFSSLYHHLLSQKILLSKDLLNDICIWAPMRLLIEILVLLWLANRHLLIRWERARLNNRLCQLVHLKARNEWLHRIIETNEKITGVWVVVVAAGAITVKGANE